MGIDRASIEQVISTYKYGKYNLPFNNVSITWNTTTNAVVLTNFYQHDKFPTHGLCSELSITARKEIAEKHPNYHIIRAVGKDPQYFNEENDHHLFLLVSKTNIMNGTSHTKDKEEIQEILRQNPHLVCPSFGIVSPFSESRYTITELYNNGNEMQHSNSLVLWECESENGTIRNQVPLGIHNEKVVYLTSYHNFSSVLAIRQGKNGEAIDLNDRSLNRLFHRKEPIKGLINKIRGIRINTTTDASSNEEFFTTQ